MVICAAFGCNSRSGREKVGFHQFPKDIALRKIWVERLGRGCLNSKAKAYVPNSHSRLCSRHFEDCQFVFDQNVLINIGCTENFRRSLKADAVPTLHLHKRTHTIRQRRASADSIENKRRKIQIVRDNNPTSSSQSRASPQDVETVSVDDVENNTVEVSCDSSTSADIASGLHTLAFVASLQPEYSDPSSFNAQCQTPVWAQSCKEVQVSTALVSIGTQTDWENDIPMVNDKQRMVIPRPEPSSYLPDLTDISVIDSLHDSFSFRDDSLEIDSDGTWLPSEAEDSVLSEDFVEGVEKDNRKFIVFESELDKILGVCIQCSRKIVMKKKVSGCLLSCEAVCDVCGETKTWTSQPSSGTLAIGHLELAAAIMFSGSSPSKFLRALQFVGICAFNENTYYNIQSAYLEPAVLKTWDKKQSYIIEEIKQRTTPLKLGGDGRCCSPGHTAKYGTYSMMDLETGKIVDLQLVQSNEVKNSHAMELEGLQRSLEFLIDENELDVSHLITDRHSSVKKYMKEAHPEITHWFDVWHVAKGIYKKLEAAGKKKGCEKIRMWARSVSNHLYWSVASSDGDGEMVKQKWLSILNHVANIHEGHGDKFQACEHEELEDRLWMKKGRKPHVELSKIVSSPYLLKDVPKLSPAEQTSDLEAFHKVLCGWVPKSTHYMHSSMEARSKVGALHFNENCRRDQSKTRKGVDKYSISYPKGRKGDPVVKEVKTCQTFDYVTELVDCVMELRDKNMSYRLAKDSRLKEEKPRPIPLAQSTPRRTNPSKAELIKSHVSRFNR